MHYQPLLNLAIIKNWLSSKCCIFVKIHLFSIILLHAHLQYLWHISAKYRKRILKAVGGVDYTNYALPTTVEYGAIIKNWLSSKCCKFVKIHFFSIILLHAYFQYLWHISAKYQKRILEAVGGVDFTNYALWQTFYV